MMNLSQIIKIGFALFVLNTQTIYAETDLKKEIIAVKLLNKFYEDNILSENKTKLENFQKLLKLNIQLELELEELIAIDKKIKKIIELETE